MIHGRRCECVEVWESERDGSPRVKAEFIYQRASRTTNGCREVLLMKS